MTFTEHYVLFMLVVTTLTSSNDTLEHFSVYRIIPHDHTQLEFVSRIYDAQAELDLDFWMEPRNVNSSIDVMTVQGKHEWLIRSLADNNIQHYPTIPDVDKLLTERTAKHNERKHKLRRRKRQSSQEYDFGGYGTYREMVNYLKSLENAHPYLVKVFTIGGATHDGNFINVIRIGRHSQKSKRAIWIDGGIHAREWASPHTAIYFVNMLVNGYARDSTIRGYLDSLDFYIVPVMNPDGYIYSMSNANSARTRMWRKNRSPTHHRTCRGVDLNRNFDYYWGETGSSRNPCSEVHQGTAPFSEVESRALRDAMLKGEARGRIDAYITMHTYGQLWLHPYGDRRKHYPADQNDLYRTGRSAINKLRTQYNTKYSVGSSADELYPAAGGSDDWAKSKAGVKYVYLLELRPDESHWDGFILEESSLLPTAKETWTGVNEVIKVVLGMQGRGQRG